MMSRMTLMFVVAFAFLSTGAKAQVVFQSSNFDNAKYTLNDRSEVRPWIIENRMYDLAQKEDCLVFFDALRSQIIAHLQASQVYLYFRILCLPDTNPTRIEAIIAFEAIDNRYVADAADLAKIINNADVMSYRPQARKADDIFTVISQKTLLSEVGAAPRLINEYQGQMRHKNLADFHSVTLEQTAAIRAQKPLDIAQWISKSIGRDVSQSLMTNYFPRGDFLDIALNANYLFEDGTHLPVRTIFAVRSRRNCATTDTGRCDGTLP
jgi:hypothetical protein